LTKLSSPQTNSWCGLDRRGSVPAGADCHGFFSDFMTAPCPIRYELARLIDERMESRKICWSTPQSQSLCVLAQSTQGSITGRRCIKFSRTLQGRRMNWKRDKQPFMLRLANNATLCCSQTLPRRPKGKYQYWCGPSIPMFKVCRHVVSRPCGEFRCQLGWNLPVSSGCPVHPWEASHGRRPECSRVLTYLTNAFLCTMPLNSPSFKTQTYLNPSLTKH